jgi:hypothetical protein
MGIPTAIGPPTHHLSARVPPRPSLGRVRIASAIVLTGLGVVTLLRGGKDRKTYGGAIWFLGGAAANAAFGSWELRIARETDQYSGGGVRCGFGFPASPNR